MPRLHCDYFDSSCVESLPVFLSLVPLCAHAYFVIHVALFYRVFYLERNYDTLNHTSCKAQVLVVSTFACRHGNHEYSKDTD